MHHRPGPGIDPAVGGHVLWGKCCHELYDRKRDRILTALEQHGGEHAAAQLVAADFSDREVIGCLGPDDKSNCPAFAEVPARRLMSNDRVTIGPDSPISEAVDLMIENGISCLPLLNH
ncbi:MAG: CBS domain-containing protein, partial [Proteobacteria bacterium]|nr:CBS domain-containing protein [Pseudomonadota bacterium]